jgi:LL-diaminopimelate aminotransferase
MISVSKRIQGTQEYYFSKKLREIAGLNQQGEDIINLGIGSPDLMPPKQVIKTLINSVQGENNHGYQSYKGIPGLRKAFALWYKNSYDVELNPETEILPLIGSKEGITYISNTYLDEGDEVLVPNPGYPAYAAVTKLAGATVRNYNLEESNNWLPDLKKLEQEDLSKVKLMWVNYPHMPTGTNASPEFLNELVAFAEQHNILLINDNPYSFILNDKPLSIFTGSSGLSKNVLELNSLSKAHNMAGWRLGMIAGDAEHISNILIAKSNVDSGMFLPIQEAAIAALEQGPEWYNEVNQVYRRRREIVWDMMNELGCHFEKGQTGLFVWGRVPDHIKDVAGWVDEVLYEGKVFITPGFIFGTQGNRYIRISLCSKEEVLEKALKRIKNLQSVKS